MLTNSPPTLQLALHCDTLATCNSGRMYQVIKYGDKTPLCRVTLPAENLPDTQPCHDTDMSQPISNTRQPAAVHNTYQHHHLTAD